MEHRAGLKHLNADALSRRPCQQQSCRHCARLEAKENAALLAQENGAESSFTVSITRLEMASTTQTAEQPESTADLQHAQEEDCDISPVLDWLKTGTRPPWSEVAPHSETTKCYWAQWESLMLRDGVVYRRWESPAGDRVILQLVVPKKLQKEIFLQLHGPPSTGHFGVTKTLGRIRERFYWVRCYEDVQSWCKSCDVCAAKKGPSKRQRAPMAQYNVGAPMERIALDILGPLPLSDKGNKYLLVLSDYFTRWPEAYPLPNQEASTVAEVLVKEFISRFGVPKEIHSDQGRNFESELFQGMCKLLGAHKTRTTPLHPQSDGLVERYNRTLVTQLAMYVDDNQKDWDEHIPLLLLAYRSAIQESMQSTPAKLMLGRELRLPVDILYSRPEQDPPQVPYNDMLKERMDRIYEFTRDRLQLSSDRMKRYHDVGVIYKEFKPGDPVWLYNPRRRKGHTPKLQKPWEGPYTVLNRINDLVYRVKLSPHSRAKVVHLERLWKYHGENPPTWFHSPAPTSDPSVTTPTVPQDVGTSLPDQAREDIVQPIPRRSGRQRRPPDRYGQIISSLETCDFSTEGAV